MVHNFQMALYLIVLIIIIGIENLREDMIMGLILEVMFKRNLNC